MILSPEPRHDLTPGEIDEIEDRLHGHNGQVTGRHDALGLAFVLRDQAGAVVGVAAGWSWAGTAELRQMWVDERWRGQGHGRALLDAFVAEAARRAVRRIWVQSYDFQAPDLYEKVGFARMAEFDDWPEGHVNVVLCRML
jgi:ribosomal protein S18 acetylase RimI-like enzyme